MTNGTLDGNDFGSTNDVKVNVTARGVDRRPKTVADVDVDGGGGDDVVHKW